jgi:hypothetical protein
MLKFGTGQITAVTQDDEERPLAKIGRALTPEEWDAVVNEIEPEDKGE